MKMKKKKYKVNTLSILTFSQKITKFWNKNKKHWNFYGHICFISIQNIPIFLPSADFALPDSAFGKPERATKSQ